MATGERGERERQEAVDRENAASAAFVAAERALLQALQHHRAASPEVDQAVTEWDSRRADYDRARSESDNADGASIHAYFNTIVEESRQRRGAHMQQMRDVQLQDQRTQAQGLMEATSESLTKGTEQQSSEAVATGSCARARSRSGSSSPDRASKRQRLDLGPPSDSTSRRVENQSPSETNNSSASNSNAPSSNASDESQSTNRLDPRSGCWRRVGSRLALVESGEVGGREVEASRVGEEKSDEGDDSDPSTVELRSASEDESS